MNRPFVTQVRVLMTMKNMTSKNIVEKGENAGNQHFLLFPPCFLSHCVSSDVRKPGNTCTSASATICISHRHDMHQPPPQYASATATICISHRNDMHQPGPQYASASAMICISHRHDMHQPPPWYASSTATICISHCHDMNLSVKVVLNPNTISQSITE